MKLRSFFLVLAGALALLPSGCGNTTEASAPAGERGVGSCRYYVKVIGTLPLRLDVQVSCEGNAIRGLEAQDERIAAHIEHAESSGDALSRQGNSFLLPHVVSRVRFRYQIDLDALGGPQGDLDYALRSDKSLLAPASSFLLYPLPLDVGIPTEVYVERPRAMLFATGLEPQGNHFRIEAHELSVATYAAFGAREVRELALSNGRGDLRLVILDGELGTKTAELERWVMRAAHAVARFYGEMPSLRTSLFVLPVPGKHDVLFGKLLPESSPGIALLVGSNVDSAALDADWLLVHELFHLGVPSFDREGKWFDEGLATYFEPIIRVRAGLHTEAALWRELLRRAPGALPAFSEHGLEHARGEQELYWGGALFCLLADVEARKQSDGRLGLEDGLRRVLRAGGRSTEVWSLEQTLKTADSVFATPILQPLRARYANKPAPFDLATLLRDLGVEQDGNDVKLNDGAPLAWVRHAIIAGHR